MDKDGIAQHSGFYQVGAGEAEEGNIGLERRVVPQGNGHGFVFRQAVLQRNAFG